MFDINTFIQESNKIDPQPNEIGGVIPGMQPGDLLFDNQLAAFQLAQELAKEPPYPGIAMDLHRVLTRGVPFFEETGNSGKYRQCGASISGQNMPQPYLLRPLMTELWFPNVEQMLAKAKKKTINRTEAAWWCHHAFECIHPFVDGNGRTGRLLLNWFRMSCDLKPIVVYYHKRWEYYDSIQVFRNREFPKTYDKFLMRYERD